jgi:hypothetical protein
MDEASSIASSESTRSPNAPLDPANYARDWGLADFNSRHAVVGNFSYQFPFRTGSKAVGAVVNGWTIDAIGTFTSGMPLTARLSSAVSGDQSTQFAERPNLKAGFSNNPNSGVSAGCTGFPGGKIGNATNWYDPCAFALPLAGTYGNLGRNTVVGPGAENIDLALEKSIKLRESANATFRAEMFNVMNHGNFGLPNTTALASNGTAKPSAGQLTYTTTSSRQIQFALRLSF